jgi:CheY-like chemotaxis protein
MSYKILVVDDEPANLNLLERIFLPHYDVVKAGSGPEGSSRTSGCRA